MIAVDPSVPEAWEELWTTVGKDAALTLRFDCEAAAMSLADALTVSVAEMTAFFETMDEREDLEGYPPSAGWWDWLLVANGAVLFVAGCEDLPAALASVAETLEREGISGRLDLWEHPPAYHADDASVPLTCRIRVKGTRRSTAPAYYYWAPDSAAQKQVLASAFEWATRPGDGDHECILYAGGIVGIRAQPAEALAAITERLGRRERTTLDAAAETGRRVLSVAESGRLTLHATGIAEPDDRWREPLTSYVDLLRDQADHLAHAFVVRGLRTWPQLQLWPPGGTAPTREAFDDLFVPDAFGAQLLGSSYLERIPATPHWDRESVGAGATLLTARDLDAWFAEARAPRRGDDRPEVVPETLLQAREALKELLPSAANFKNAGYADIAFR